MAKKECPSCAVEIEKQEEICPICGYEFPQPKSTLKWIALGMLILFIWILLKWII
ncbi:MAG: hypothetical protein U5R06_00675 [candidate division KSB1 bacterium]|nr:hypothetical protein [candidate division KSB1 bacterium]